MDQPSVEAAASVERVIAYDRRSVELFFAAACERRAYLLTEITKARRRIAEAEVALASSRDIEARIAALVLNAQREMNEDALSNRLKIRQAFLRTAADAEQVANEARATVSELAKPVSEAAAAIDGGDGEPANERTLAHVRPVGGTGRSHERRRHPAAAGQRPLVGAATAKQAAPAWTLRF